MSEYTLTIMAISLQELVTIKMFENGLITEEQARGAIKKLEEMKAEG